jgi:hypothetical protein
VAPNSATLSARNTVELGGLRLLGQIAPVFKAEWRARIDIGMAPGGSVVPHPEEECAQFHLAARRCIGGHGQNVRVMVPPNVRGLPNTSITGAEALAAP